VESFDTLILRGGVNRSYTGYLHEPHEIKDHRQTTYTRDEWVRSSEIAMTGLGSHGIFVHLYLNGLYWGLYNIVERPDDSFAASYLGGDKEEWGVMEKNGPASGSPERFEALNRLAREGDFTDPNQYAEIESYLDVTRFIDYVILNWYAGNRDWGHTNWYAIFRNPSGKVKYMTWDSEVTWIEGADDYLGEDNARGETNLIMLLFRKLMANSDFRMEFTDRIYTHLFNDGALTVANSTARWMRLNNTIDPAIVAESARWGDARYETPITRDDWLAARDDVLIQMGENVTKFLTIRLDDYGWYPEFNPPTFNRPGGLVPVGFDLTMKSVTGTIYYTTDGTDPRAKVTGEVAPTALVYRPSLVLTQTTSIKARTRLGQAWSALGEATFRVVEQDTGLRLAEIMYNPIGGGDYEFIELKNAGNAPLPLAQMRFEGISFTFPAGAAALAPGESVVLVRDPAAFAARYPGVPIGGTFGGQLSNRGETIVLKDWQGNVVTAVSYDDENGWPVSPDGRGDSLVMTNLRGDPDNPRNWRASVNLHGSPGADEPG
jgi:hypothetical protein